MAEQEPLNATFFALQKRERSGVLLQASLAFGLCAILLAAAFVAACWPSLTQIAQWASQLEATSGNPEARAEIGFPTGIFGILPLAFLWLFFFFVLTAAYEAACLRWMVRGETGGLFGLTLGADTWRVYLSYWVWFGLHMCASMAFSIVMWVLVLVVASFAVGGASAGADPAQMGLGALAILGVLYVAYFAAMLFFAVRFAPAAATSIAQRRFSFFDAWVVTRGRFTALLGPFLVLHLMRIVVSIVLGAIGIGLLFTTIFMHVRQVRSGGEPEAVAKAFGDAFQQMIANPASIALVVGFYVVTFAVGLLFYVLFYGVNARAASAALAEGKIAPLPA